MLREVKEEVGYQSDVSKEDAVKLSIWYDSPLVEKDPGYVHAPRVLGLMANLQGDGLQRKILWLACQSRRE